MYKIKPLVWADSKFNGSSALVENLFTCIIIKDGKEWSLLIAKPSHSIKCESLEAGKAIAEKMYEDIIKKCLIEIKPNERKLLRDNMGRFYRGAIFWKWTRNWRHASEMTEAEWQSLKRFRPELSSCETISLSDIDRF